MTIRQQNIFTGIEEILSKPTTNLTDDEAVFRLKVIGILLDQLRASFDEQFIDYAMRGGDTAHGTN